MNAAAAATVIDGKVFDADPCNLGRPPNSRRLARSPVIHVKTRGDSYHVSADSSDGNHLRLVTVHSPNRPAIRRACLAALMARAGVTDEHPPSIGGVVGLIQDDNAPDRKTTRAVERDLGGSLGITGRPTVSVAITRLNLGAAHISRMRINHAYVSTLATAVVTTRELQNGQSWTSATKGDVTMAVESDSPRKVVGSWI